MVNTSLLMTINCDIMLGQATDSPVDDDTAATIAVTFEVVAPPVLRTFVDVVVDEITDTLRN